MDISTIQGFLDQSNQIARSRAFQYFEQLKVSDTGWQASIECLLSNKNDTTEEVKFFCFQILMNYVKTRYQSANIEEQRTVRNFVIRWIHLTSQSTSVEKSYIQNKASQVICTIFLMDYPSRWPTFFKDILQTLPQGPYAADLYLRILLAINTEIADRDTPRPQKEFDLFTLIKDTMRETSVKELVDSWHQILVAYKSRYPEIICLCLQVIGSFIAWIDINYIANEHFVLLFIQFLSMPAIRDDTCDCINQIVNKGMDPAAKIKLVESFALVLEQAGALKISEKEEDEEFTLKVAQLVNGMGTTLLTSWTKLQKLRDPESLALASEAVRGKAALLLKFLNSDDKDVSQAVIEFAREYLQFLKHQATAGTYGPADVANVEAMLCIVINRYKYDNDANFSKQGHEEALFEEYRKALKNIFDNLALLDVEVVFNWTEKVIIKMLHEWRSLPFEDIEVAIMFLYLLGEIIPISHPSGQVPNVATDKRRRAMAEMVWTLVSCGVSNHGHVAVTLQFFETIVRFEKFFIQQPQLIPEILRAFMDIRGLRNSSPHVRSRTSYLFSRFIKCLKAQVQAYTEDILRQLQDLLALTKPLNHTTNNALLSPDDQLYLYETTAILIVSASFESERRKILLTNLLTPVFEKFEVYLQQLPITADEEQRHLIAKSMNHAIAVTSRTSKAFYSQQTMKSCGCTDVYLKALQVFLGALNLPYEQCTLQSAVRQYLHRMVVCLEDEVIPYFPLAAEQLLKNSDIRSIQEFIPLINQVIGKFKKKIVPFLQQVFKPLVAIIFSALSTPIDESDEHAQSERQLLQRSYFLFIAAIVTNDITEVIAPQDMQSLEQVLLTVIRGAVDFPDPVAQKTCFGILKKMVEMWGNRNGTTVFVEFMYNHIVPACFLAPLKDTFDLNDAQTILALSESALCLKMMLEKRGEEFELYLQSQYLPTLNVSPQQIQEYCHALKSDTKAFKTYLKFFFLKART